VSPASVRTMGRAAVHPIEVESMRILASRVDLSHLPPLSRAVTERVIHSAAEVAYADDLVLAEAALARGWDALAAGAPIVADSRMVAAGITRAEVTVPLTWPRTTDAAGAVDAADVSHAAEVTHAADVTHTAGAADAPGTTRSAAAMGLAAERVGAGAVWVVGNAPTALEAVIARAPDPALVVGLPVGFVGAVEAKEALRASGLPAVSNRSELGGSAVAAAAVNALLYTSPDQRQESW
jgi:precorrin-8X/cobalt-precorrin-8 methylmutase